MTVERAERFVAQHGRPGNKIILGNTSLFAPREAIDLPRRLYDETLSGSRSWILVVPGVIHNHKPRINEGFAMWYLEGATLLHPLPGCAA